MSIKRQRRTASTGVIARLYTPPPERKERDHVPSYPLGYRPRNIGYRGLTSSPTDRHPVRPAVGDLHPAEARRARQSSLGRRSALDDSLPARALDMLASEDRPWSPEELARRIGTSTPVVSKLLYYMAEKGKVQRERHPQSRRRWVYRAKKASAGQEGAA